MGNESRVNFTKADLSSLLTLSVAIVAGFLAVLVHGSGGPDGNITAGFLLAVAALFVGGFVGFLFGIPRTLQQSEQVPADGRAASQPTRYQGNTNLEQISDWLTKILVGVGLTQLGKISASLTGMASTLAPAFGKREQAEPFVLALLIFFGTVGFLFSYLWTRIFLAGALARADVSAVIRAQVDLRIDENATTDAKALSLIYTFLQRGTDVASVNIDTMKDAIRRSSPSVKVQAFYRAEEFRRTTWRSEKNLMERTIPVFEALTESDTENRFHQNHGQLGYALKDKSNPDWQRAEEELTTAISIRGDDPEQWWSFYEFNRAICRIMLDKDFAANKVTSTNRQREIKRDIEIVKQSNLRNLVDQSPIREWLVRNP
jgi:hypothetical protein